MNNNTLKAVKIIFIFFVVMVMAGGGYFLYDLKFVKKNDSVLNKHLVDNDFNKLIEDINDTKNNGSKIIDNNTKIKKDCYIDNIKIENNQSQKLYSRKIVNPYEDCENYAKERMCDDGYLLGDKKFIFSSCDKKDDCQLPNDEILKNGKSIKLYSKKTVPYGETCERYAIERKCQNNVLLGDKKYIYKICHISYDNSCNVGNGHVLADNQSHVFYKKPVVKYGKKCVDNINSKRLVCSDAEIHNGSLKDYPYWDCIIESPKDCYIEGHRIDHGSSHDLYSKKFGTNDRDCDFFKDVRGCYDGFLDGQEEYHYWECFDN